MPFGGMLTMGLLAGGGAVAGGLTQANAAKKSLGFQKGQAQNASAQQNQMFNLLQQYYEPYAQTGLNNLPLLEYMITGAMPDSRALTSAEAAEYGSLSGMKDQLLLDRQKYSSSSTGSRSSQRAHARRVANIDSQLSRLAELEKIDRGYKAYEKVSKGDFLQSSPLYKYQQEQTENALNKQLAARGMYGSSYGLKQLGDANRALAADESERQVGRVGGLVTLGMGGAQNLSGGQQNTANALGNIFQNLGNAGSQSIMAKGNAEADMYSGLGAMPLQMMSTYNLGGWGKNNALSGRVKSPITGTYS